MPAPPSDVCPNPPRRRAVQPGMEREENFEAGDRNSGNGTLPGQQEAQEGVFEDGQNRDTTGDVRPTKGGESYVYGDSRPDRTEPSDTFVSVDDSPMMTTTREDLPEVHTASPEFLRETSHGQNDEIRPQYRKEDGGEGAVLVEKEGV